MDPKTRDPTFEAFVDVTHPEDREQVRRAHAESMGKREGHTISHRLLMKDLSIKFVHVQIRTEFTKRRADPRNGDHAGHHGAQEGGDGSL